MSGIKWVDIIPTSTDITTVYVGHSADLDNRSIGSRMGGAARDAARTLASRIESATGQTVRIRTQRHGDRVDQKSTRLNSSHVRISYAVFCLKKKNKQR